MFKQRDTSKNSLNRNQSQIPTEYIWRAHLKSTISRIYSKQPYQFLRTYLQNTNVNAQTVDHGK